MPKVFIVEDHPVVRKGYVAFISRERDVEVCGEASSGQEALKQIAATQPDIVVLDVSLPGDMNGIDLLRELKRSFPDLLVLVVSGNDEAVYGDLVVRCGAWGYVMKGDVETFMRSVRGIIRAADQRDQAVRQH
jgi:DNA-binding NarL/FixJ family response regulator